MDNRAVSPVMAVISMAAIAIALAATVMVVAKSLGKGDGGHVEPIAISRDERAGQAVVAKDSDLDWHNVQIKSDKPLRFALNAQADSGSTPLPVNALVPASAFPRALTAASYLDFCGDPLLQEHVHVTLVYNEPGRAAQILDEMDFLVLEPCL